MSLAFLLLVMTSALAITGIAHKKGWQPGLLIVLLGAAVSFVPGLPRLQLPPELILGVVVPPLLYSAAYGTSLFQFMRNLQPILTLGVTLVVVSTVVLGYFTHWLLPSLGLAGAFLLAAVISPPDTVTSVSHGRALGLTRRVQGILMGESLVNDATALTLFALALNAVTPTHMVIGNPVLLFLYQAVVGSLVGVVMSTLGNLVRRKMVHPNLETAFGFVLSFAAYLCAELLHASGILAVVLTAFSVSLNTLYDPHFVHRLTYRTRLKEREFWPVVDALLESFVFAYMGLQLRFVLDDLRASGEPFLATLGVGLAVLVVLMLLRLVWVFLAFHPRLIGWVRRVRMAQIRRTLERRPDLAGRADFQARLDAPELRVLSWQENILIGWTGMRGIITLAAAAGIPLTLASGAPVPGRAVILTIAFTVTIGTLLIQGATLPLLSRWLKLDLKADDIIGRRALETAYATAKQASSSDFEAQRKALTHGMMQNQLEESAVRVVTLRQDLEQAAHEVPEEEE